MVSTRPLNIGITCYPTVGGSGVLATSLGEELALGINGTAPYVVRAVGFGPNTNWLSFRRGMPPVEGWHRIQARRAEMK